MFTHTTILWAVAIFLLRICDVSLGTMRMITIIRGWRLLASLIGFAEVTIFIIVISRVITHIDTWINVVAYSGGFAVGTFVGITIERHLAMGNTLVKVISKKFSKQISEILRTEGFGVTELTATGKEGPVTVLESVIERKQTPKFIQLIEEIDRKAFITTDDMKFITRGYFERREKKK